MCMRSLEIIPRSSLYRPACRRSHLRVHRLINRFFSSSSSLRRRSLAKKAKDQSVKVEMKMKNLKLYMENQSIIEENEKLRKKALLLHQENQLLFSQLHNFNSKQNHQQEQHHEMLIQK